MRDLLRSLPVFAGPLGEFVTEALPRDPVALFVAWLKEAVAEGVPEPHAMTLSTVDASGIPDARVLILKEVDDDGWWFASDRMGAKGRQIAVNPVAALTFYWPQRGRQVRVRGRVVTGSRDRSEADFLDRGTTARAVALASRDQPLSDRLTCQRAVEAAQARLVDEPDLVSANWQAYAVEPITVEFWQADKDRMHARVRYERARDEWTHRLLWP